MNEEAHINMRVAACDEATTAKGITRETLSSESGSRPKLIGLNGLVRAKSTFAISFQHQHSTPQAYIDFRIMSLDLALTISNHQEHRNKHPI